MILGNKKNISVMGRTWRLLCNTEIISATWPKSHSICDTGGAFLSWDPDHIFLHHRDNIYPMSLKKQTFSKYLETVHHILKVTRVLKPAAIFAVWQMWLAFATALILIPRRLVGKNFVIGLSICHTAIETRPSTCGGETENKMRLLQHSTGFNISAKSPS